MHIKKVKAKRFLSVGEEGIEIDFTRLGRIVNIKGINHDYGEGASNGTGKCFAAYTPILMYDGTIKRVQHIEVGDLLMGDDSTPRKVLSLARGRDQMYRVKPKKGIPYIVNSEHILVLKSDDRKDKHFRDHFSRVGDEYHIKVKDYVNQSNTFKNITKGIRASVDWPKQEVPIDPYILGVWLGTSAKAEITNVDEQVIKPFVDFCEQRNLYINVIVGDTFTSTTKDRKKINSFKQDLKNLCLLNNKHIPHIYKVNDYETRMALLAGLMDADGHFYDGEKTSGYYEIISKFKKLADGIVFLARSLGFGAYMTPCKKSQYGTAGLYYRISISGHTDRIPVRIPYKSKPGKINKDVLKVGIEVTHVGEGDYYGFQIDGNQKFLLGDFTVVHNSSIIECVVYALYGELLKGLNHKTASHIYSKKGLEVEIEVDDLRIVRRRNPDVLELYEKGVKISGGGIPATQQEINNKLKLSYDGFVNVACFGQHSLHGFLESTAARKREIAENLLNLDYYARYHEVAKKQRAYLLDGIKQSADKLKTCEEMYAKAVTRVMTLKSQQSLWQKSKLKELSDLTDKINRIRQQIESSGEQDAVRRYGQAQQELEKINKLIEAKEGERKKYSDAISASEDKYEVARGEREKLLRAVSSLDLKLREASEVHRRRRAEIERLQDSKGKLCPTCKGPVREENVKLMTAELAKQFEAAGREVQKLKQLLEPERESLKSAEEIFDKISKARQAARSKEIGISSEVADLIRSRTQLLRVSPPGELASSLRKEEEMLSLRLVQAKEELANNDPYKQMILVSESESCQLEEEISNLKSDLSHKEKLAPYYEYWVRGFGDKGIRSFLLEERIPALNSRMNFWLQILIDNRLKIYFDRDLNETIRKIPDDSRKFIYNSLSGGELSRIDLSISQAFAYVTMLSSGACPSIIALDEVGANFDRPGIVAIYRMICELSKDRQVLVITHDPNLLELLSNCDTITAVMKNGVTKLEIEKMN